MSGDRLGNSEQMLQGEVLYLGKQVGACEIPDSTVRGRPVQGHVFFLAAIHREDDWRESGAPADGYT